jgi:hypothetical protein
VSRTLADPLASLGALPESKRAGAGTWTNGFGEGPQGPVKQLTREEALAAEKSRVEGEVKGWVIDEVAFARARDGRDAYWQGVQDSLTKGFAPGWTLLDNRPASTSGLPRGMRQMAEIYKRAAGNYGKSGSPISPDAKARGMPGESSNENMLSGLAADRGMRGTAMDSALANIQQAQAAGGSADNPWSTKLIVHVLLTQTSDGALEDVSIAASSGNADYDKLVLGQARSLSAKGLLGAPPKDRRRTLWAFEADFEQAPPMPVAGCQLDVNFVPTNCFYPMKKSVHSRVTLEAVY